MLRTRKRSNHGSAGFTLVEVAISAAIMVIIGLVVTKFWISTSEAFVLDNNKATIKQQSERALEIMTERIRQANAPSIVLSNGNSTINFVDSSDGSNVQYTLTPLAPVAPTWGEITQTINGGASNAIGGYAQALQFTATPTGLVTINATFIIGSGRTQSTLTVQSSVGARN